MSGAVLKYLEPDEIVEAIENAFSPLECRVELFADRNRLGFSVFDTDGSLILPCSSWFARLVRKPDSLRTRINVLRKRVEAEGYTLDPGRSRRNSSAPLWLRSSIAAKAERVGVGFTRSPGHFE